MKLRQYKKQLKKHKIPFIFVKPRKRNNRIMVYKKYIQEIMKEYKPSFYNFVYGKEKEINGQMCAQYNFDTKLFGDYKIDYFIKV